MGGANTRAPVRLCLSVTIAMAVAPMWPPVDIGSIPMVVLLELATGLATGAMADFVAVQIAGQIIGISLGLGFAAQYDPSAGENASIVRTILSTITGLAFLGAGGIEAIAISVARGPSNYATAASWCWAIIGSAEHVMADGLALAAPVMIAIIITQAGLALANRAAPALNVYAISFAVIMTVGAFVLLATAPTMVQHLWSLGQEAAESLKGAAP